MDMNLMKFPLHTDIEEGNISLVSVCKHSSQNGGVSDIDPYLKYDSNSNMKTYHKDLIIHETQNKGPVTERIVGTYLTSEVLMYRNDRQLISLS
jgi:hypothetical protein